MKHLNRIGRAVLLCLPLAGALAVTVAVAAENEDYAAAVVRTNAMAEKLASYELRGTLVMENNVKGMSDGMKMEAAVSSAARWPDRLFSAQKGSMVDVNLGVGPKSSWFYLGQLGTAYRGDPVQLTRDRASADSGELSPERVFNFFGGIDEMLLPADLEVLAETGHETLTVGGREVSCQVFRTTGDEADPAAPNAPVRGPQAYWFDPESALCLKVNRVFSGHQNGVQVEQQLTFAVSEFALDGEVPDERFVAAIPAAARIVSSFERLTNPDAMTGEAAPDLSFTDLEGNTFALSDYRGKVVFLDFWATWCGPCRMEMPHIETLHRELGPGGDVVFLAASNETKAKISGWLKKNPYTFRIAMVDGKESLAKYKTKSIPAGFVIDREGIIRAHMVGAQSENQLRAALAKAGIGK